MQCDDVSTFQATSLSEVRWHFQSVSMVSLDNLIPDDVNGRWKWASFFISLSPVSLDSLCVHCTHIASSLYSLPMRENVWGSAMNQQWLVALPVISKLLSMLALVGSFDVQMPTESCNLTGSFGVCSKERPSCCTARPAFHVRLALRGSRINSSSL